MNFLLYSLAEPYLPEWYTCSSIVPVGFVATLAAFMMPLEAQGELVTVLEHVAGIIRRPSAQVCGALVMCLLG